MPDALPSPSLRCLSRVMSPLVADPADELWREVGSFELGPEGWVKAIWSEEALQFLFFIPREQESSGEEAVSVFLDPVGDREAYFEIGVTSQNVPFFNAARRSRSGTKVDSSWRCERFSSVVEPMRGGWSATLLVPFSSLGSIPPGPGWKVALEFGQTGFRPPRRWISLDFVE